MHRFVSFLRSHRRPWTLAVVLWAFGLATTTLLVGLWGRAVATDEAAMAEAVRSVIGTEVVAERLVDWMADALAAAGQLSGPDAERAARDLMSDPDVTGAVEVVVGQVVAAAVAPSHTTATIDVRGVTEPLAHVLVDRAEAVGLPLAPAAVDAIVEDLSMVVVEGDGQPIGARSTARARTALTIVAVVASAALIVLGSMAVALSDERARMVRTLAVRLGVSAMTFAVFLRISAWALDPARGRAPFLGVGSAVLGSNHMVVWAIAVGSGVTAAIATVAVARRRRPSSPALEERQLVSADV